MEPETLAKIREVRGLASRRSVLVGVPRGHLSEFGSVVTHELAHVFSHSLWRCGHPFKAEGFACYAAWLVGADPVPFGVPLHHHLAWLLSVGVHPSLRDLWAAGNYGGEIYDLSWSFTCYVAQRFGREAYFRFYSSNSRCLDARVQAAFGLPLARLEREWHDEARHLGAMPASRAKARGGAAVPSRAPGAKPAGTVDNLPGPANGTGRPANLGAIPGM